MGIYIRKDSPNYWLLLDGFTTPSGVPLREPTKIRHHAPTPQQRKDNHQLAEVAYAARLTQLARDGVTPAPKAMPTFAVQAAWYVTHRLPQKRGKEREAPLIPKLVAVFGPYRLAEINQQLVTECWITPRRTTPTVIAKRTRTAPRSIQAGPRTINREVAVIKAILQSAVPDYLDASPLYGMPLLPTKTPKRRLMTEDEERRLLEVLAPDDTALFLLGLDSLVRLMDLLDAKTSDDHGDRIWIGDPKAGGGLEVPISARARVALNAIMPRQKGRGPAWPKGDAYLFPRRRVAKTERDRRNGIRQMLQRACAAADPPIPYGRTAGGLTFHWATRRTGLTRMLTRGVDLGTAQKIGDWKTADVVLSVYHELIDEAAHAAVNIVGRRRQAVGDHATSTRQKNTRKQARKRR